MSSSSSKRHWPSMFKSKPNSWHRHYDITHSSALKPPAAGGGSYEEIRSGGPEPKARWNPKREQIRILESIFNSGMVNPSRDEIRNIRVKLQEYGQVGDANVFYWFQNRKSRTKHKLRQLHAATNSPTLPPPPPPPPQQQNIIQEHPIAPPLISPSDQTVQNPPSLLIDQLMGYAAGPPPVRAKSTVVINGMELEVAAAEHLNVKAAFGEDAVLIHYSSGEPLYTNECGVTINPLQDGAYYYLVRTQS